MSYVKLIDAQLATAYRQLKDLAEKVTFVRKQVTDFDFNTGEPAVTSETDANIFAVVLEEKKKSNVRKLQILFKTVDLPFVSNFDQVIIKDETWTVGPIVHQRRYVTLLDLYLGGSDG